MGCVDQHLGQTHGLIAEDPVVRVDRDDVCTD